MAGKLGKLLKKAAKKKAPSKSKSKTPTVQRDDLDEAVEKWLEADKMAKDGKALKEQAEAVLLPEIEDERVKKCREDGEHHSSVKVNGKVTVSARNAYSKIDATEENEETLRDAVGDRYDEFFKEKTAVALKPSLLDDEEAMSKIIEAVGEENFERFFDVKQHIEVTEAFHKGRATNPKVAEQYETLADEGLVKPSKNSVKRA